VGAPLGNSEFKSWESGTSRWGKSNGKPPKLEGGILQAFLEWVKFDYCVFSKNSRPDTEAMEANRILRRDGIWMHESMCSPWLMSN
jgi:hypothetical protein